MASNLHLLETAKILYTTGFFIISSFESILTLARYAIENNKIFAINLSAVYICDSYLKELLEIIEYADCVFGNEDETSAFGRKVGLEFSDLHEVTTYISKLPKKNTSKPRIVTTTQGKNPVLCSIYSPDTDELFTSTTEVDVIDKENIMDLNGAGDAFVGGFLAQFVQGRDVAKCIDAGLYLSGDIIKRSGTCFPTSCHYE